MKKALCFAWAMILLLSLVACSNGSSNGTAINKADTGGLSENDIKISITDLQSNLNEWHHFSLDVSHSTDKYLTAEVYGVVYDQDGNELGSTTAFVHNLGPLPGDWVSEPFLAKAASGYQFDYKVISYEFNDGTPATPEITSENVNDYIRLTYEDFGDIHGKEKEVSCEIHNLTAQYFSGTITVTVSDQNGNRIEEKSEFFDNLGAYETGSIMVWFPIVDDYTIEYSVNDFQLSESPIA